MGYQSAPYWWIVCDEPGCEAKSTEGSGYAAWGDQGGARDEAIDSDWREARTGDLFFCWEHSYRVCGECEKHVSDGTKDERFERDSMCDECWEADQAQAAGRD